MFKIGIEAEGIYKGFKTLFVIEREKWHTIVDRAKKHKCNHIYIGADKSNPIDVLCELKACSLGNYIITAEVKAEDIVNIPTILFGRVRFIVRFEAEGIERLDNLDMLKIDTGRHCYITTKCQTIENEINYLDKEIE